MHQEDRIYTSKEIKGLFILQGNHGLLGPSTFIQMKTLKSLTNTKSMTTFILFFYLWSGVSKHEYFPLLFHEFWSEILKKIGFLSYNIILIIYLSCMTTSSPSLKHTHKYAFQPKTSNFYPILLTWGNTSRF